jgi:hypothetical protein
MAIVRSILGVVLGWVLAFITIMVLHVLNFIIFRPESDETLFEHFKQMGKDVEAMKAWLPTVPMEGMLLVLAAWTTGAFLGGAMSALIAARAHIFHASIVGTLILVGTIYNFYDMRQKYDFSHPDWMIICGLLLPVPASMLGGRLVEMMFPPAPPSAP